MTSNFRTYLLWTIPPLTLLVTHSSLKLLGLLGPHFSRFSLLLHWLLFFSLLAGVLHFPDCLTLECPRLNSWSSFLYQHWYLKPGLLPWTPDYCTSTPLFGCLMNSSDFTIQNSTLHLPTPTASLSWWELLIFQLLRPKPWYHPWSYTFTTPPHPTHQQVVWLYLKYPESNHFLPSPLLPGDLCHYQLSLKLL